MKHIVETCLQGWKQVVSYGWTKPFGLALVCGAIGLALGQPSRATAVEPSTPVTQLEYLQWLVQAYGDSSQFTPSSTPEDYVAWAKNKGLVPMVVVGWEYVEAGWTPDAALTKQMLAQSLVQLLGISVYKGGVSGNYTLVLSREGIVLPDGDVVTRAGLVTLFDDVGFQYRVGILSKKSWSPKKGDGKNPPPGKKDSKDQSGGQGKR
jgi:hypothetical protein